jgi:hypothetical protein
MSIIMTGFNTHLLVYLFVQHFGEWTPFVKGATRLTAWWALIDIITVLPVQLFYAERAYKIMGNKKWVLFALVAGM